VELLEVVRRAEQEERRGARLAFDEVGIGLVPAVLDGALVDDLDLGRLAVDQKLDRRAGGESSLLLATSSQKKRKSSVVKGWPSDHLMAGAQLEGELAAVLGFVALEDVGNAV
jgi:hypothetical protein